MKNFSQRSISAERKEELIAEVGRAVAEWQHAAQGFDEAAAAALGTNLTDLRCLGTLYRGGPATAGHLAKVVGVTPGAMTMAIDRLQRVGYVERVRDTPDRRQVRVAPTPLLITRFEQIWGPLAHDSQAALRQATDTELVLLRDLLHHNRLIQEAHTQRLKDNTPHQ